MKSKLPVQIKVLPHGRGIPEYATIGSAGVDLVAAIDEPLLLEPGQPGVLVPTGVAIYLQDSGYVGFLCPRSGLGHKKGLCMGTTFGVIDSDYQNEIFASLCIRPGYGPYEVSPGERIAQYIALPVTRLAFSQVNEFSEGTQRGLGGFGSTGTGKD